MRQRGTAVRQVWTIGRADPSDRTRPLCAFGRPARHAYGTFVRPYRRDARPPARGLMCFEWRDGRVRRRACESGWAADSLDSDRDPVAETRFNEVIQKNFFASNLVESSATRTSSTAFARVAESIVTMGSRARRTCKKLPIS